MKITKEKLIDMGFRAISDNFYAKGFIEITLTKDQELKEIIEVNPKRDTDEGDYIKMNHERIHDLNDLINTIKTIENKHDGSEK